MLKHETSTLRQSHNFISIDFKFGMREYVREVTSPAKVCSVPMSGRDATWGQHIRLLWLLFYFYFFILQQSYTVNLFLRAIAPKTRSGVRKTLWGWEMRSCDRMWGVLPYFTMFYSSVILVLLLPIMRMLLVVAPLFFFGTQLSLSSHLSVLPSRLVNSLLSPSNFSTLS